MEELFEYHDIVVKNTQIERFRYLYHEIDWSQRMTAIKGPRGTGKTTLMLQRIKKAYPKAGVNTLYVTMEHPYFFTNSLYDFAKAFYINGGRALFLDEVHKYPQWSRELKVIYDGFPDLQLIFSASSALDIFKGTADLSRRLSVRELPGLSFREYLNFTQSTSFNKVVVGTLFTNHREVAAEVTSKVLVMPAFKDYLKSGYYPFFTEMKTDEYLLRLTQVINTVVEVDLAYIDGHSVEASQKIKKLLRVVAESAPFKPNISEISRKTNISRDLIYNYLQHLESAHLVSRLTQTGKGVSTLQKPDKLFLDNSNLSYALIGKPDVGNMRETFAINQFKNAKLAVSLPKTGDVFLDEHGITIEIGGKNKSKKQVSGIPNAFIAKDDTESGFGNTIPLWLLGFLY
jgi:hypothetical protein